jgi:hypothetical protein
MMFAPLEGWRHVKYTDRHVAMDFSQAHKDLSDAHLPQAKKIILFSTHKPASLCKASPAA